MADFEPPKFFFGRERELSWALYQLQSVSRSEGPFIVSGISGIGKTALLAQLFKIHGRQHRPLWYTVPAFGLGRAIDGLRNQIRTQSARNGKAGRRVLVLDQVDTQNAQDLSVLVDEGANYKLIERVVITTRQDLRLRGDSRLEIGGLSPDETQVLFAKLAGSAAPEGLAEQILFFSEGSPGVIKVLAQLFRSGGASSLENFLSEGKVYQLVEPEPGSDILLVAKPQIILANEDLFERLRREPQSIYSLPPCKFEETIAELLDGMGMQVELTPQSRDEGRDILAYMDSPVGKFLTLVECKRYREDNKVGIELVKQLFGTLTDSHANRAMLVTTSSFTKGTHDFQKKYEWKMELKDYGNVVDWISKHKQPKLFLPGS